jgi:hypothetical protein
VLLQSCFPFDCLVDKHSDSDDGGLFYTPESDSEPLESECECDDVCLAISPEGWSYNPKHIKSFTVSELAFDTTYETKRRNWTDEEQSTIRLWNNILTTAMRAERKRSNIWADPLYPTCNLGVFETHTVNDDGEREEVSGFRIVQPPPIPQMPNRYKELDESSRLERSWALSGLVAKSHPGLTREVETKRQSDRRAKVRANAERYAKMLQAVTTDRATDAELGARFGVSKNRMKNLRRDLRDGLLLEGFRRGNGQFESDRMFVFQIGWFDFPEEHAAQAMTFWPDGYLPQELPLEPSSAIEGEI